MQFVDKGIMLLVQLWHRLLTLRWRHNGHHSVSNHRSLGCLFYTLFKPTSKKTSRPALLVLCEENSPLTGEFSSQRTSNAENVSIWWRHNVPPEISICLWNLIWNGASRPLASLMTISCILGWPIPGPCASLTNNNSQNDHFKFDKNHYHYNSNNTDLIST